jgi:hypothetical protein
MRAYRPEWQPWLLGDNIAIFVSGHPQVLGKEGQEILRTVAGALVVAIAYAVVLLVAAGASLRARDVT